MRCDSVNDVVSVKLSIIQAVPKALKVTRALPQPIHTWCLQQCMLAKPVCLCKSVFVCARASACACAATRLGWANLAKAIDVQKGHDVRVVKANTTETKTEHTNKENDEWKHIRNVRAKKFRICKRAFQEEGPLLRACVYCPFCFLCFCLFVLWTNENERTANETNELTDNKPDFAFAHTFENMSGWVSQERALVLIDVGLALVTAWYSIRKLSGASGGRPVQPQTLRQLVKHLKGICHAHTSIPVPTHPRTHTCTHSEWTHFMSRTRSLLVVLQRHVHMYSHSTRTRTHTHMHTSHSSENDHAWRSGESVSDCGSCWFRSRCR